MINNKYTSPNNEENLYLIKIMHKLKAKQVPSEKNYARTQLIENNLSLVNFILYKHFLIYENNPIFEDLISIGRIALVNAVDKYDINAKCKFSTYAYNSIFYDISKHFQVNNYDKRSILNYSLSLDQPIIIDKHSDTYYDIIPDTKQQDVADFVVNKIMLQQIFDYMTHLQPNEQFSLIASFGLFGHEPKSQTLACETLKCTKQFYHKIKDRAFYKLSLFFKKDLTKAEARYLQHIKNSNYPKIRNKQDYLNYMKHQNTIEK